MSGLLVYRRDQILDRTLSPFLSSTFLRTYNILLFADDLKLYMEIQKGLDAAKLPVSYTHLTLPTIYSV